MSITCPVCLRATHTRGESRAVVRHLDGVWTECVMSGRTMPVGRPRPGKAA